MKKSKAEQQDEDDSMKKCQGLMQLLAMPDSIAKAYKNPCRNHTNCPTYAGQNLTTKRCPETRFHLFKELAALFIKYPTRFFFEHSYKLQPIAIGNCLESDGR